MKNQRIELFCMKLKQHKGLKIGAKDFFGKKMGVFGQKKCSVSL